MTTFHHLIKCKDIEIEFVIEILVLGRSSGRENVCCKQLEMKNETF